MYTEIKRLLTKKFVGDAFDMTFILTEDKSADARRRGKTVLIAGKIFSAKPLPMIIFLEISFHVV